MKAKHNLIFQFNFVRIVACFLIVFYFINPLFGQNLITVKGKVYDEQKQPLIGASVRLSMQATGTVTDIEGNFTLPRVASNDSLVISFVGFQTQKIAANSKQPIIVYMVDNNVLQEVVAIGYASIQKRDLTGSITSINAESITQRTPVDLIDAIQGQASGVQISTNAQPGTEADIRIRGTSTFESGITPLYIVDGMPMGDISGINPSDIQSMEILKDAASTAIYGSRSANGVIIVTTKKGVVGSPKFDVRYMQSYSNVVHTLPLTSPEDARKYVREKYRLSGATTPPVDTLKPVFNFDGNMGKYLYRTSVKKQLDVNVSGAATDRMNFYLGGGLYSEDGVVVNSGYKRLTLRLNSEYKASNKLTVGVKTNFSFSDRDGVNESTIATAIYQWVGYWNIFDVDGNIMRNLYDKKSAYATAMLEVNKTRRVNGSILNYLEYAISPKLKFTSNLSGSYSTNRQIYYRPEPLVNSREPTNGYHRVFIRTDWMNENYFSYNEIFKNHNITFLLGNSTQARNDESLRLSGQDYTSDLIYTLNAASRFVLGGSSTSFIENNSLASFFSRINYSYKSKYLMAANLRYDGSSRFGKANRWGAFPSVSGGWRFSDEKFFRWTKPELTDGKIRISYGVTGNESIGNYRSLQIYESGFFYQGVNGLAPVSLAYDRLGWEKTSQLNGGIDLILFKSRLKVTADVYTKNTTDLLYSVEVPKETGYLNMTNNIGGMLNKGAELTVDYNLIRQRDWNWNVNLNISNNVSYITKLSDGTPFYPGGTSRQEIFVQEGRKLGEIYGYKVINVFSYNESNAFDDKWNQLTPKFDNNKQFIGYTLNGQPYTGIINQKSKSDGTLYRAGEINWMDNPNDPKIGVIDDNDRFILGCTQPDLTGAVNSTLSYKEFTLFMSFNYSLGGVIYNRARFNRNNFKGNWVSPEPFAIANMWLNPGDNAIFPAPIANGLETDRYPIDFYVEDASYVRLRNLRLNYSTSNDLRKKLGVRNLQAYVYVNNLFTWSKYKGYDPEFGGSALIFGVDSGTYPRKREIGFGGVIGL